jgi:hypothetical protein
MVYRFLMRMYRNRSVSSILSKRTSLVGEELEARCLPVSYRWDQAVVSLNDNWSNSQNWDEYSVRGTDKTDIWHRVCA